jgi:hypothetical protein
MKNIFNGKRFMSLLQKEAYDLRSQYLKLALIVACTFLVVFIIFIASTGSNYVEYGKTRFSLATVFVCGGMLLAPFQLYKRYNNKIFGVNYFMLPASQAEKWLSMFINCVIVTPIVMILTITLIDVCTYPFLSFTDKSLWLTISNYSNNNFNSTKVLSDVLLTFFAIQSLFFLGNIWFKRAKVQKTILAIIILMIAFGLFAFMLVKVSGIIDIAKVTPANFSININDMSDVSQTWKVISKTIYYLIAPVGLWIVSFMKMREQQF